MRKRTVFTLVVFGALALAALIELVRAPAPVERFQTPPEVGFEPFPAPDEGPAAIYGRISHADGRPGADVVVECLIDGRPRWTTSAESGAFRLEELPAGEREFLLLANGLPPTRLTEVLPRPGAVLWTLEPPLSALDPLPSLRRRTLEGRLVAAVGASGTGYEVVLEPAPGVDPLSGALPRRTTTDAVGVFGFEALVEARYVLRVLPPWVPGGSWPVLAELEFQHPPAEPLSVVLGAGRIEVELVDAGGAPVAGAVVHVSPESDPNRVWPAEATDAAGRASVHDLPAGKYTLEVLSGNARTERVIEVPQGRAVLALLSVTL